MRQQGCLEFLYAALLLLFKFLDSPPITSIVIPQLKASEIL